ncbi:hypothetical protein B005_0517 [Nocardiopsis alba ATCC BAA-2165]|uniref:Uncharacterized protein n=1 Tax=Nocardiopsis alba (strain ATCC BAA-2165 / BE74) TaxID=1205910 RepID=J7L9B9_NOCAA|nr:hypothetical protein B005_0517 [Nocardiopsis alba ATCC BAA-2165]
MLGITRDRLIGEESAPVTEALWDVERFRLVIPRSNPNEV